MNYCVAAAVLIALLLYALNYIALTISTERARHKSIKESLPDGVAGEYYAMLLKQIAQKCRYNIWGLKGNKPMRLWERPSWDFEWDYGVALYKPNRITIAVYLGNDSTLHIYLNGHDFLSEIGSYDLGSPENDCDRISEDIQMALNTYNRKEAG